jgi:2-iminobutanoate/2-iminopropanoate deaminase
VRQDVLGECRPASTIVITGIVDDVWFLDIEAIAAA